MFIFFWATYSPDIPGLMGGGKEEGEEQEEQEEEGEGEEPMDEGPHKAAAKSPKKAPIIASKKSPKKSPNKAAGLKRPRDVKSDQSDDGVGTPVAKRAKKPVCKYGPKCYQGNEKHMEEFDHPWVINS